MKLRPVVSSLALIGAVSVTACARGPAVETSSTLPLRRVVVYRNGVGYFEREGRVSGGEVRFRVLQSEVGDFLATLAVMERGGSSVRAAAFPMPPETTDEEHPPNPRERRPVRVSLDPGEHDLFVGYTVETPIWRPSYRLVFDGDRAQVQAWGIVQNVSGEDWRNVRLSLVAGSPVSFRSELAEAVIPPRPVVTDRGAVIDAVPQSEIALRQQAQREAATAATAEAAPAAEGAEALDESDGDGVVDQLANNRPAGRSSGSMTRARGPRRMAPTPRAAAPGYGRGGGVFAQPAPAPPPPPPSSAPRNLAALAALAVQGGATRYDLPTPVTIPNESATMVMLVSRDVPGRQMHLFAPDPGVPDSASHPFHVARFDNGTGALLERGPIAIFERGAFLGQGMLETLPDGATTTVPFALERGIAVEHNDTYAVEGERLVRMVREALTVERYNVVRTTYRVRNGLDHEARVLVRQALNGGQIFEPREGTTENNGNALVPVTVPANGNTEAVVVLRRPFTISLNLESDQAAAALTAYLRDGHPPDALAATLRQALELRQQIHDLTHERTETERRRNDLQQNSNETRENLRAIQRNATAADLRAQLTARLSRVATEIDQVTRRIVELDTQIGERRVRLNEALRGVEFDAQPTTRNTANDAATPPRPMPR